MAELFRPGRVRRSGSLRWFKTPGGSHVIVFPKCRYPLEALAQENWGAHPSSVGRSRTVFFHDQLANGEPIRDNEGAERGLYVKNPERDFYGHEEPVRNGQYWFGQHGYRSGIRGVGVSGGAVEHFLDLEARTLLYLMDRGLRVEEPQAIIIDPDGRKLLVTHEVGRDSPRYGTRDPDFIESTDRMLRELGIEIPDFKPHNMRDDDAGNPHVLDVFRASHGKESPLAVRYERHRARLIRQIIEAIGRQWPRG